CEEQRKISDCLSFLDACIGTETRKLDALKAHKQGLMQKLFPAEGQSLPRLRFSGFEDKWEAKLLKDVSPLKRGFDLPSNKLRQGKVPVVYSNGVQNFHDTGIAVAPGIVTGRSGTIGKINFIGSGKYWPHNTSLWVTSFCGNVPLFVYYLFNFIGMERFVSGSGVPTLNRNDVHIFQTHVPSPAEQNRIATCLSSMDDLLAAQSRKIDALRQHKKGLTQGLFPGIEVHVP
ncbi:MAG: restriction endonuclease subunit S, partial [Cytophagaceae bacterium]